MTDAHDLYVTLQTRKMQAIQQVLDEQWQESPVLDFKTVEGNAAPMKTKAQQTLAEALSGFANSEGGVIVWGVDARPTNPGDPDVVTKLQPISNLKRFLSDLQLYTAQLISPPMPGVEHDIIEDPSAPQDTGFAITYVPKGEGEPYMARAKDQHRFYCRSGCSFLIMDASMLSDRYGRRPHPRLELAWRLVLSSSTGTAENPISSTYHLILGIRNAGLGVALYPALALFEDANCRPDPYGLDGNGHTGLPERLMGRQSAKGRWHFYAGGVNDVIHPSTVLEVTRVKYVFSSRAGTYIHQPIKYELYCQGFSRKAETIIEIGNHFGSDTYSSHS